MSHTIEMLNVSDLYAPSNLLRVYDLSPLVADIKKRGVKVAISVQARAGGHYQVLDGHARVRACRILGIQKIPARVLRPAWMTEQEEIPAPQKMPAHYVWVTETGKQLRPKEIMDGHLGDILRMLYKNGREDSYDFKVLSREAARRDLKWMVDPDIGCSFLIDDEPCEAPMAMWTAAQEPRCEAHRTEKECAGCLQKKEPAFGSADGTFWCYDCAKPDGLLAVMLAWLIFFLTLGRFPKIMASKAEDEAVVKGRKDFICGCSAGDYYPECKNCPCPSKAEPMEVPGDEACDEWVATPGSVTHVRCGCECHERYA